MNTSLILSILLLCAVVCLLAAFRFRGKSRALSLFAFFALAAIAIADTPIFAPGNSTLSIQTGYGTTSGSNNITISFASPFSGTPQVVSTLLNATSPTNFISSITTSNFNWNPGTSGSSNSWIAIGPR